MFKFLVICSATLAVSIGLRKASQLYASTYTLYTQDNHKYGQKIEATPDSVITLTINSLTDCAIIVHGRDGTGAHSMNMVLRDAFITSGNINVIVVDWSVAAGNRNYVSQAVPAIGENVAELLNLLVLYSKISTAKLHLVGFDVGAHVVGCIGRAYKGVARITALNPVGGDEWMSSKYHVRPGDALYVEAIHTEVAQIGLPLAVGDVDFFPNGGVRQPGCRNIDCSHNRAWQLFAASLTHGGIIGYRCNTINAALNARKPCTGFTLPLGNNDYYKYGSGLYSVNTTALYPYRCKVKCGLVDRVIKAIEATVLAPE